MPYNKTIEGVVPKRGLILDYGCGHGLLSHYLKLNSPKRKILGVDIDNEKISVANNIKNGKKGIDFKHVEDFLFKKFDKFDAIVMVDVLPYMKYAASYGLLKKFSEKTDFFIIKDQDNYPRLRFLFLKIQETIATKIAKYTSTTSPQLCFRNAQEMSRLMSRLGFKTKILRLKNFFPYPDIIYLCKKITTEPSSS